MIEVVKSGLQTTIQDGGRPGYLAKGIPPSGAQDNYALRLASVLVGNAVPPPLLSLGDPGDGGLEMLLTGPVLRFHVDAVVAVTGAEMTPKLDDRPISQWETVRVPAGSHLNLGTARRGARGYLGVAGGIDVPKYLGSRSTYLRGSHGGLDGRALRAGDTLQLGVPKMSLDDLEGRRIDPSVIPDHETPTPLRVVAGPQEDLFLPESVALFYATEWKLSPVADRMGFRFIGPRLYFHDRPDYLVRDAGAGVSDIVDDTTPLGGIQVPGGVEPIVLGVEVPSAGGYAKIATVISADIGRLGQLRPGVPVRFVRTSLEDALRAGQEQERAVLAALASD